MPIAITVGGIDRTSACHFQALTITNTIAAKADVADLTFTTTGGWHPAAANVIYVTNGNSTEFGGVAMSVREEQTNPSQFRYTVSCRDFVYLLDRTLVVNTYPAQAASLIVKDLISSNTSGFTSSGVQASPAVSAQVFDYQTVSDCIQGMADNIGWSWTVGYDKDVKFFNAVTSPAPVSTINVDGDTTTYGSLVLTEDVSQIKNSIFLKGFGVKSSGTMTQTYPGDGVTKFFNLGYEPGSTAAADISATRTPAGGAAVPLTIYLDQVDAQPDNPVMNQNTVAICYDNLGARFDVAPASSDLITFTQTVMREIPVNVQDTVSQSTMAAREGGSGVHEFAITDPGLKSNDGTDALAQYRGLTALQRYAYPRLQAKFHSFIQGWKAGQTFTMISAKRYGGFSKTMYVQTVTKTLVNSSGPTLRYEVEVADSPLPV